MQTHVFWTATVVAITGCSSAVPVGDQEQTMPTAFALAAGYSIDAVPPLATGARSFAYAINDAGVVAGAASKSPDSTSPVHAIRWTPGSAPKDLGLLPGGAISSANAINAINVVAGSANVTTVSAHGFVYVDPGPMKDIGWLPLGGLTPAFQNISANGINDGTHSAVSSNAYRVTSTYPISAYQFNPLENVHVFSNDASLLLPVAAGRPTTMVGTPPTAGKVASRFGANWRGRTRTSLCNSES